MNVCLSQGEVVALDRIRNKIDRIRQNAQMLHLRSIKAYCFNSIQAVSSEAAHETEGSPSYKYWSVINPRAQSTDNTPVSVLILGPPFPPESFDRVLLDAPCSGLGQRPNMASTWSLKEIRSYQPLQRKLFHAVGFTTQIQHFLSDLISFCSH